MARQRKLLLVEIVDRFKKEQPVIDSERQLSGKVVDEDTRGALERSDQMTPEQLLLIDVILTLPETSPERELQRRIAAIHAVTACCGVEEGRSHLHVWQIRFVLPPLYVQPIGYQSHCWLMRCATWDLST